MQIELQELSKSYSENETKIFELEKSKNELENYNERYEKLSKEHGLLSEKMKPLVQLSKDLSGANPKMLRFETWALGIYFSDVIAQANKYLLRISSERYEFILDTQSSGGRKLLGLDLLVHDYQDGHDRSTETLSGGETFMASISLALGLTEVISNGNISLDSLFIDEGFGSLDKNLLSMAIESLRIFGQNKMIGIISHIEEMKTEIPSHIEIIKTTSGSHISI